jgi:hypothetical protein
MHVLESNCVTNWTVILTGKLRCLLRSGTDSGVRVGHVQRESGYWMLLVECSKYIHTYIHTHVRTYVRTHTHTHTHTHTYVYIYIYIYIYIHTYTHTYTHTHTFIQTFLPPYLSFVLPCFLLTEKIDVFYLAAIQAEPNLTFPPHIDRQQPLCTVNCAVKVGFLNKE